MKKRNYQFCASCIHFESIRTSDGLQFKCKRLGYNTQPNYSFHCWQPKPRVKKRMEKEEKL